VSVPDGVQVGANVGEVCGGGPPAPRMSRDVIAAATDTADRFIEIKSCVCRSVNTLEKFRFFVGLMVLPSMVAFFGWGTVRSRRGICRRRWNGKMKWRGAWRGAWRTSKSGAPAG